MVLWETGGIESFRCQDKGVGLKLKELEKDFGDLENCGGIEQATEDGMKLEGVDIRNN